MKVILVAGCGALGRHYVSGLSELMGPSFVYVFDKDAERSRIAVRNSREAKSEQNFRVVDSLGQIDTVLDLAIVATTADARVEVVRNLLGSTQVNALILEKPLAQTVRKFSELRRLASSVPHAVTNYTRRYSPLHQAFYDEVKQYGATSLRISIPRGSLATNATHYLDFFEWLTASDVVDVSLESRGNPWFAAKREGFFELNAKLVAQSRRGETLEIVVHETSGSSDPASVIIEAVTKEQSIFMDEESCTIQSRLTGRVEVPGIPLQSEITAQIAEDVMSSSGSLLPTVEQSASHVLAWTKEIEKVWGRHFDGEPRVT